MLNISRSSPGEYIINYFGNRWVFHVYLCGKKEDSLRTEIKRIEKIVNGIYCIVPCTAVKSFFNIVQGMFLFLIHEKRFVKARNKGLLLSMLIIGKEQLRDAIEELEKQFNESEQYYLVTADNLEEPPVNGCTPADYECVDDEIKAELLKNIYVLLDKL